MYDTITYMDDSPDARTFFINVTSGMLSYIRAVGGLCRPAPNDIRDRGPHQDVDIECHCFYQVWLYPMCQLSHLQIGLCISLEGTFYLLTAEAVRLELYPSLR